MLCCLAVVVWGGSRRWVIASAPLWLLDALRLFLSPAYSSPFGHEQACEETYAGPEAGSFCYIAGALFVGLDRCSGWSLYHNSNVESKNQLAQDEEAG